MAAVDGDDAAFLEAIVALLNGDERELASDNKHYSARSQIKVGIAEIRQPTLEIPAEELDNIVESVVADLTEVPDKKMESKAYTHRVYDARGSRREHL